MKPATQPFLGTLFRYALLFAAIGLTGGPLAACGDEGDLKGAYRPTNPGDNGNTDEGEPYPIKEGDTFWFQFSRSYRESTGAGGGGLIEGEKQSSGFLCTKVTGVNNKWLDNYASEVIADVKVVGTSTGGDLAFSDQDDADATATAVDGYLAPLWGQDLTMATRGHGYAAPKSTTFYTRATIALEPRSLGYLLFFDPRDSENRKYGGWDPLDDPYDCYLNTVYNYFIGTYGSDFFLGPDFHKEDKGNTVCDDKVSPMSCEAASCLWDAYEGRCIGAYQIGLTWRYDLGTGSGTELQGPVIHSVAAVFASNGSLRSYDEYIIEDVTGGASLQDVLTSCGSNACATANITLRTEPWASAYCKF